MFIIISKQLLIDNVLQVYVRSLLNTRYKLFVINVAYISARSWKYRLDFNTLNWVWFLRYRITHTPFSSQEAAHLSESSISDH